MQQRQAKVKNNLEVEGLVGIGTSTPKARLHVTSGSVFIEETNGLILLGDGGTCRIIRVNTAGTLYTIAIPCP